VFTLWVHFSGSCGTLWPVSWTCISLGTIFQSSTTTNYKGTHGEIQEWSPHVAAGATLTVSCRPWQLHLDGLTVVCVGGESWK